MKKISWKKIRIGVCISMAVFTTAVLFLFIHLLTSAPDIDSISVSPRESATYICSPGGTYLRKLTMAASNRDIVSLSEIPESLQHAIIAIEDERFYEHGGIDLRGILRAFASGISSGSFSEGASTITQQLIKNSVFTEWTQENSFWDRFKRKVQEQYLALQLEDRISKDEILEDYLNTINFGAGCYGVQAASHRYFGKDVSELTLSESAVLAAIPQNPSGYNPITNAAANQKRQRTILDYMKLQGYISESDQSSALSDNVYERIHLYNENFDTQTVYSYYEDALIEQVTQALITEKDYTAEQAYQAVYGGGLRIFTAQDPEIQKICDEEFRNTSNFPDGTEFGIDYALSIEDPAGQVSHFSSEQLRSYVRKNIDPSFDLMCSDQEEAHLLIEVFRKHILYETGGSILGERLTLSPQPQASIVILDQSTGLVKAIVGGRGEKSASFTLNRAVSSTRQPGSTFKILTAYAPALENAGKTLASTYENGPYTYADGTSVNNWDMNDYSGTVTIREAITRSINVIAVKCITEISPRAGFAFAQKLGISTLHETWDNGTETSTDIIQPLALGGITQGVTNLELCSAYASIADGGWYISPSFFTKVLNRHGDVLLERPSASSRVMSADTAFLLTSAMQDVVSSPDGTAYGSVYAAGHPVSGKTGTTSDYRDIWFAGYTPYYTCCVWGGYDNNQPLPLSSTSHVYNKVLWSSIMSRIHAQLPVQNFKMPDSIETVTLCRESHLLAKKGSCTDTYAEFFSSGTAPDTVCDIHEIETEHGSESESESESETEHETESESKSEAESESESEKIKDIETKPETDNEMNTEMESEITNEVDIETESELNSLDDLLFRLESAK